MDLKLSPRPERRHNHRVSERRAGSDRKAVNLLVKLAHSGIDEFVEKYATNLSPGGMFIRSRDPKPLGTLVHFKIELASGARVMQGSAVVKWVRGMNDPEGPPGMGVSFETLDPASQSLVNRMLGSAPSRAAPPARQPPPPPRPKAPAALPEGDEENPFASFGAPPPPSDMEVDIELDTLVASTDSPPPAPRPATDVRTGSFEIDLDIGEDDAPLELDLDRPTHGKGTPPPKPAPKPAAKAPPSKPAPKLASKTPATIDFDLSDDDSSLELEIERSAAAPAAKAPPTKPAAAPAPRAAAQAPAPPRPSAPPVAKPVPSRSPAAPPPLVQAPPAPTDEAALPELRRGTRTDPTASASEVPALLQQLPIAPHLTRRAPGRPVYLQPPASIDPGGPVVGIDLGTTNSCCAILSNGRPQILASKDGYNTIPSVVALGKHGLLVGHRAKAQMVLNPNQSIYGAKRLVGRDFDTPTVRTVKERFHYDIVAGPDGKAAVTLGGQPLALEEVQGLVLRECKAMAEQHLGRPVSRAVITCPAYYSDQQREAVRKAAAMAGLKVERVLNEPTAAALAFGLNRELSRKVLVYDLGGGTFDATLLRIDKNVFEVLSTGGDIFLGGIDFDNQIVDLLLQKFQSQHSEPFSGDAVALSRVTELAERAKVALSERTSFDLSLPMLQMLPSGIPLDLKGTLTRDELNAACKPLVDRTLEVVREVLTGGSLKPADVDDIILVGGMSRMPAVRDRLKTLFNKTPHASVNADEAVALGAALFAGTVDKVSSVVLIDVVPMTIGYGAQGGAFKRVIERNAPLPATKSFNISTARDDETFIEIELFQGEDTNAAANEYLGTLRIEGLPKGPKGAVTAMVTVRVDGECVVHVDARELRTRKSFSSTLATRYSPDEIRQRLGVTQTKPNAAEEKRAEELASRGGRFWKFLKKVVGKK
ncbi:MAG: TIGR02266 family protein [Archangium sp.]|nr:TIGR02266 family protein [Archangium sp.]